MSDLALDKRVLPAATADIRGEAVLDMMTRLRASYDWRQALALTAADIPTSMLPHAVRSLAVQAYVEPGMKESYVRSVVENALRIKAQEGTIKGVRYALGLLGMSVDWTQWHERTPPGAPGTYTAVITINELLFDGEPLLSERTQRHALAVIDAVKRWSQDGPVSIGVSSEADIEIATIGADARQWCFFEGVAA